MLVKDIMQSNPIKALPSDTAEDIAVKMAENNIGSVLICEQDGKLRGIVTDRDIACKVVARGLNPSSMAASEFMSTNLKATRFDTDLDEALETMHQTQTRRLPVTAHGRLVGILSSADVAGAFKNRFDHLLELEESYVKH